MFDIFFDLPIENVYSVSGNRNNFTITVDLSSFANNFVIFRFASNFNLGDPNLGFLNLNQPSKEFSYVYPVHTLWYGVIESDMSIPENIIGKEFDFNFLFSRHEQLSKILEKQSGYSVSEYEPNEDHFFFHLFDLADNLTYANGSDGTYYFNSVAFSIHGKLSARNKYHFLYHEMFEDYRIDDGLESFEFFNSDYFVSPRTIQSYFDEIHDPCVEVDPLVCPRTMRVDSSMSEICCADLSGEYSVFKTNCVKEIMNYIDKNSTMSYETKVRNLHGNELIFQYKYSPLSKKNQWIVSELPPNNLPPIVDGGYSARCLQSQRFYPYPRTPYLVGKGYLKHFPFSIGEIDHNEISFTTHGKVCFNSVCLNSDNFSSPNEDVSIRIGESFSDFNLEREFQNISIARPLISTDAIESWVVVPSNATQHIDTYYFFDQPDFCVQKPFSLLEKRLIPLSKLNSSYVDNHFSFGTKIKNISQDADFTVFSIDLDTEELMIEISNFTKLFPDAFLEPQIEIVNVTLQVIDDEGFILINVHNFGALGDEIVSKVSFNADQIEAINQVVYISSGEHKLVKIPLELDGEFSESTLIHCNVTISIKKVLKGHTKGNKKDEKPFSFKITGNSFSSYTCFQYESWNQQVCNEIGDCIGDDQCDCHGLSTHPNCEEDTACQVSTWQFFTESGQEINNDSFINTPSLKIQSSGDFVVRYSCQGEYFFAESLEESVNHTHLLRLENNLLYKDSLGINQPLNENLHCSIFIEDKNSDCEQNYTMKIRFPICSSAKGDILEQGDLIVRNETGTNAQVLKPLIISAEYDKTTKILMLALESDIQHNGTEGLLQFLPQHSDYFNSVEINPPKPIVNEGRAYFNVSIHDWNLIDADVDSEYVSLKLVFQHHPRVCGSLLRFEILTNANKTVNQLSIIMINGIVVIVTIFGVFRSLIIIPKCRK